MLLEDVDERNVGCRNVDQANNLVLCREIDSMYERTAYLPAEGLLSSSNHLQQQLQHQGRQQQRSQHSPRALRQ